jgi:hypothetical protein
MNSFDTLRAIGNFMSINIKSEEYEGFKYSPLSQDVES